MNLVEKSIDAARRFQENPNDKWYLRRAVKSAKKVINRANALMRPMECIRCGLCCKAFWIGLTEEDLDREPRLISVSIPVAEVPDRIRKYTVSPNEVRTIPKKSDDFPAGYDQCPLLMVNEGEYDCGIYQTRPNTCRNFEPSRLSCHPPILENGIAIVRTINSLIQQGYPREATICRLMEYTGNPEQDTKNKIKRVELD